ncbi:MAG: type II secretion system protein GspL [Steroidobacteraceae bacterium]
MATSEWLLLRLPAHEAAPLSWAAADMSGRLLSMPSHDTGGSLHTLSTGRRIALLVPGADVALFQVPLPPGNEARLLQLAPFALEDQLAQDVELLHFAVGARDARTGLVPVAVVERTHMQEWLARAAALQLLPQALFAESDLAPVMPGHVTMVVAEEQLLLRQGEARPLLLPASDPVLALEMLLGAAADLATVHLSVYSTPEFWPRHAAAIETLRSRVASCKVQLASGGLLALFAQGLAQSRPINLLQGAFRQQQSGGATWRQWRAAAIVALALLLVHGIGSWWQLGQLRKASADMEQSIAGMYGAIFPGQAPGAAPRRALEKRLAEIAGGAGQQGELLQLLAAVAAARQNVPVAKVESLNFKPGSLQMRLAAPDAATLEMFSQALRAGGYGAQVTAGNQRGERYEGQVDVTVSGT